jgi:U2 small nuclear ribonucleoprotein B''
LTKVTVSNAENDERKRAREADQEERDGKKRRGDGDDMEMDEDEDEAPAPPVSGKSAFEPREMHGCSPSYSRSARSAGPAATIPASPLLYCENLPAEVTEDVLGVLFQQFVLSCILRTRFSHLCLRYSGFQGNKLSAVDPNTKSKTAHVRYDTAEQATVALEALNGFQIKRGWKMRVAYTTL